MVQLFFPCYFYVRSCPIRSQPTFSLKCGFDRLPSPLLNHILIVCLSWMVSDQPYTYFFRCSFSIMSPMILFLLVGILCLLLPNELYYTFGVLKLSENSIGNIVVGTWNQLASWSTMRINVFYNKIRSLISSMQLK